jgi:hypothetical protein
MKKYPAYIVGNGNLGFHIAELFNAHKIPYERLNREVLKTPTFFKKDAIVWLCIPDSEVPSWIEFLSPSEAIVIYCSGGLALHEDWKSFVGVWYPLYSFRKELPIDWNLVPLFTEAYDTRVVQYLSDLSETLGMPSQFCTSDQRGAFHLAAVFVNNFTNALFSSAETILVGVPRDQIINALWPIAHLTVTRWATNPASQSQTGPAIRSDQKTLQTHLQLLKDFPQESVIYGAITQYIAQNIKQKD